LKRRTQLSGKKRCGKKEVVAGDEYRIRRAFKSVSKRRGSRREGCDLTDATQVIGEVCLKSIGRADKQDAV
jgi:hypothetical protein